MPKFLKRRGSRVGVSTYQNHVSIFGCVQPQYMAICNRLAVQLPTFELEYTKTRSLIGPGH